MERLLETRSGIGKAITSFNVYIKAINESESYDSEEINKKMKRAILWLNLNANLYGRLLAHLDIYGSDKIDPPTMCTNGISIIFHPKFVQDQSDEALRFVLAHEVLHCMFQHNIRRENRDPRLWNVACDYAINPLLIHDDNFINGKWKKPIMGGKEAGLYERKYAGMRAEDIYQLLLEDGAMNRIDQLMMQAAMGEVNDPEEKTPEANEDLQVQEGKNDSDEQEDAEGDNESGEGEPGEGDGESEEGDGDGDGDEEGDGEPGEGDGEPGEGDGEPGEGNGEPGEGEGNGEPGEGEGKPGEGKPGESNGKLLPKVGDKVVLKSGGSGTIKKVYNNGDIEI
jgi:hypothetical protein